MIESACKEQILLQKYSKLRRELGSEEAMLQFSQNDIDVMFKYAMANYSTKYNIGDKVATVNK